MAGDRLAAATANHVVQVVTAHAPGQLPPRLRMPMRSEPVR